VILPVTDGLFFAFSFTQGDSEVALYRSVGRCFGFRTALVRWEKNNAKKRQ
jgi:hypothetical protein